jgi:hypothetical protein
MFAIFGHQKPGPIDPDPDSPKSLDPVPDLMNPDPRP